MKTVQFVASLTMYLGMCLGSQFPSGFKESATGLHAQLTKADGTLLVEALGPLQNSSLAL